MTQPLKNKLALITGASRGLGAGIARQFAAAGADLILVATNIELLEALDDELAAFGVNVTLVPLDLQDLDKIAALGQSVTERFGKLDILIGNAAVLGVLSPIGHVDDAIWRKVFDVNVHANWALIKAFDPLLRLAPQGRARFVTSKWGSEPEPYWSAYSASKAALESMVKTYSGEIANICPNLKVDIFQPGRVHTDMYETAFPGGDYDQVAKPDEVAKRMVAELVASMV